MAPGFEFNTFPFKSLAAVMKWANFAFMWKHHLSSLGYSVIWVVDDDIEMHVDEVNLMFNLFHRFVPNHT